MVIKAFAKINLAIDVLKKDEEGYHGLDMLSVPIALHDTLEIEPLLSRQGVFLTSDDPTLICDESNLAYRALLAMEKLVSFDRGYRIQIYKRIPMEAGLGGGSADAAGVIRAICALYQISIEDPKVVKIAREIGSDVPFCLINRKARVRGTGEIVEPIDVALDDRIVIVKPHKGLSTKVVFDAYDAFPESEREHPDIDALLAALRTKDEAEIAENMKNGLSKPACQLCPVISGILNDFKRMGFSLYAMTGSGNACFALTKDWEKIEVAKRYFTNLNYVTITSSTNIGQ